VETEKTGREDKTPRPRPRPRRRRTWTRARSGERNNFIEQTEHSWGRGARYQMHKTKRLVRKMFVIGSVRRRKGREGKGREGKAPEREEGREASFARTRNEEQERYCNTVLPVGVRMKKGATRNSRAASRTDFDANPKKKIGFRACKARLTKS